MMKLNTGSCCDEDAYLRSLDLVSRLDQSCANVTIQSVCSTWARHRCQDQGPGRNRTTRATQTQPIQLQTLCMNYLNASMDVRNEQVKACSVTTTLQKCFERVPDVSNNCRYIFIELICFSCCNINKHSIYILYIYPNA